MSGHPCFASLAGLPDRSTPCRPAAAEASNRAVGPVSNPFPSRLLPSGLGMVKPPSRKREIGLKCYVGATRREWVTSAGSPERLVTGARNGLANVCSGSRVRIARSLGPCPRPDNNKLPFGIENDPCSELLTFPIQCLLDPFNVPPRWIGEAKVLDLQGN